MATLMEELISVPGPDAIATAKALAAKVRRRPVSQWV